VLTTGPAHGEGGSFEVSVTDEYVWALRHTRRGSVELWRAPLGSDSWSRSDAPDMANVIRLLTVSDQVALETFTPGTSDRRLQHSADGAGWSELALPCGGESQLSTSGPAAFVLCRPEGKSATLYRAEALASWQVLGRPFRGGAGAVLALADDRVLLVDGPTRATVMTPQGPVATDLGLPTGDFVDSSSSSGVTSLVTTLDHRMIGSTDGGLTWHPVD
jgi:hypothetical protein